MSEYVEKATVGPNDMREVPAGPPCPSLPLFLTEMAEEHDHLMCCPVCRTYTEGIQITGVDLVGFGRKNGDGTMAQIGLRCVTCKSASVLTVTAHVGHLEANGIWLRATLPRKAAKGA